MKRNKRKKKLNEKLVETVSTLTFSRSLSFGMLIKPFHSHHFSHSLCKKLFFEIIWQKFSHQHWYFNANKITPFKVMGDIPFFTLSTCVDFFPPSHTVKKEREKKRTSAECMLSCWNCFIIGSNTWINRCLWTVAIVQVYTWQTYTIYTTFNIA